MGETELTFRFVKEADFSNGDVSLRRLYFFNFTPTTFQVFNQ